MKAFHFKTIGLSVLLGTTLVVACGDDEDTTTGPTSGPASTSTSTTTTSTSAGGATSTSTSAGGTGGTGVGGAGGAGVGGSGGGSMAQAFCAQFEADCGFGMDGRFADEASCIAAYEANADCQACWQEHLDNVTPNSVDVHCPHACGDGNPSCPQSCPNECQ